MVRTLLLVCAIFIVHTSFSNKTDSLRLALKTAKKPIDKINTINLLSKELFKVGNYDTTFILANEALKLAEKNKYNKGIASACNNLANVNIIKANYEEAHKLLKRALKIHLEVGDKLYAADTYNNLGIVFYYQGDYPEALKNYLGAFKLVKELNDQPGIARSYSNLGNIYLQQGNLDEALTNYNEALKMQESLKDLQGIGRTNNNIASVYMIQKEYEKSVKHFKIAIATKESIGDIASIGRSYLNMGGIYFLMADLKGGRQTPDKYYLDTALTYYTKTIAALEKIGDKQTLASTYNNLGLVYVAKKQPAKAREFVSKGLALAKEIKSLNDIMSSYNGFAVVDSAMGNYKGSLENYKMFVVYRDSLVNDANTKKITEDKMNFDFEQKEIARKNEEAKIALAKKYEQEKKDALHEEQITRQKVQGWSIAGGVALVLLSVILLINRSRLKQKHLHQRELNLLQKEKASALMEVQEQERKRIAEDLHDSLGHLLSAAKMNLQSGNGKEQLNSSIQLLNQASEELRNISFNLMPNVLEEEGLTPALNELAEKSGKSGKMAVSFQAHGIKSLKFDKLAQFNIYRIVQEAINNIMKHAGATEAGIQLIGKENNLTIMIEDNGKGFDPKNILNGRGQKNMRARTNWLNGNFHLDSSPGHGTTICIDIPAFS